jgi:glycosyltransferase involved in cell wall biosynthesis
MKTSPAVSVFMPSYNKGAYAIDGIRSIFNQSRTDWELWILENSTDGGLTRSLLREFLASEAPAGKVHYEKIDVPDRIRQTRVVPTWLLNTYYPDASGRYIFYISDDDLAMPTCFEQAAGFLDQNPDIGACWFSLRRTTASHPGDPGRFDGEVITADGVRGLHTVCDRVDGGQIMHRKSCLDEMTWPWFEENPGIAAGHWDGLFMDKLVVNHPLHPVPEAPFLVTHRHTPISMYSPRHV